MLLALWTKGSQCFLDLSMLWKENHFSLFNTNTKCLLSANGDNEKEIISCQNVFYAARSDLHSLIYINANNECPISLHSFRWHISFHIWSNMIVILCDCLWRLAMLILAFHAQLGWCGESIIHWYDMIKRQCSWTCRLKYTISYSCSHTSSYFCTWVFASIFVNILTTSIVRLCQYNNDK